MGKLLHVQTCSFKYCLNFFFNTVSKGMLKLFKNDVSMGHLIDNGEEWMEPLLELRDFLQNTVDRSSQTYDALKYRMNNHAWSHHKTKLKLRLNLK